MLSSAWPSLGDLYSPSSVTSQAPGPAPCLSPGEEVVALCLGAGPASLGGPREGSKAKPGRAQPRQPERAGVWVVKALGAGGEELRLGAPLPRRV